MFAIQSEIAQKVAKRLHVKISSAERLAIERPPTADITAFDLYSRAKNLGLHRPSVTPLRAQIIWSRPRISLNQAVAHDPSFFQAYCQLASVHDQLYYLRGDHTPARLALAEAAIDSAFRLRPDAAKHISCVRNIFIADTAIMTALLRNWKSLGRPLSNERAVIRAQGLHRASAPRW